MDTQAYRVAVLLTINDQLSKQLDKVSKDASALDGKFGSINKSIQSITKSATAAAKALERMNTAMTGKLAVQAKNAGEYAKSMQKAAEAAASTNRSLSSIGVGGAGGLIALATANSVSSRAASYGGGRLPPMLPPPSNAGMLPSPSNLPVVVASGRRFFSGGRGGSIPPGGGDADFPVAPGGPSGSRRNAHGMENLALAYGGFEFMKSAVETGAEYQTLLARFSSYGMGDAAVKEADKFAQATKVMGASKVDMLRYFTEAQGVFRESGALTLEEQLKGARMAAPMLAKMHFAMASMDPAANHMTDTIEMDMLRFVEQAGGLNSPAKFNAIMDNAYKAVQSSGGKNVNFSQLRQFMSKAGTSAYNLSDTALYAKLEPIIGEMKGGAAGDALMTAYNRLTGVTKLPNQVVKQLEDMGVWDKRKIVHNSMGGIKSIIGGPGSQLADLKLLSRDPVEFYEKVIRPKYAAKGLSEEQIQLQNSLIFGRQGGKMFNLIEKQMHVIELAAQAFDKQMGIDDASKQTAGTYNGKKVDFDAKWKDFQLALAQDGGLLDIFTSGLTKLTAFLEAATEFSNQHPKITSTATSLIALTTAFAALRGGAWLMKTAFSALFSPLNLLTGPKGISLLSTRLGALSTSISEVSLATAVAAGYVMAIAGNEVIERWKAMKEGRPYDQIQGQQAEMSEMERLQRRNWARNNPGKPFPGSYTAQANAGDIYPEPKNPLQTIQVHSSVYLDKTKVGDVLTQHIVKNASRAPTGPSGVDPTMSLIYPGAGSLVTR